MREFVQSLKRLYSNQRITVSTIDRLFDCKRITAEERDYIINDNVAMENTTSTT